jgi:hypothetical protein
MNDTRDKATEKHRFRCEVRLVLRFRLKGQHKANNYLELVKQRRGKDTADILREACRSQWERGNRGELGVWK